jgi:hypothetical protein
MFSDPQMSVRKQFGRGPFHCSPDEDYVFHLDDQHEHSRTKEDNVRALDATRRNADAVDSRKKKGFKGVRLHI